MTIKTVEDLKRLIKYLPPEMPVHNLNANGDTGLNMAYTVLRKDYTDEEYDGQPDMLVITE